MKPNIQAMLSITRVTMLLAIMLLFSLGLNIYLIMNQNPEVPEKEIMFCGTQPLVDLDNLEKYRQAANFMNHDFEPQLGRDAFNANCAACHKLSEKRSIGPGLHGLKERIPSSEWLMAFMKSSTLAQNISPSYTDSLTQNSVTGENAFHKTNRISENDMYNAFGYALMQ